MYVLQSIDAWFNSQPASSDHFNELAMIEFEYTAAKVECLKTR